MKKPIPFGKYTLLERINVGGMAEVFKAKTFGVEGFERLVAVKRILPNIAEDEEFIAMFIDEAKIAVQLQHANIAQIFDLGKVEGSFFIALEYVLGRDLRATFDRLRQRGEVMPFAQACFIVMQVCEGLDYAHNKRDAQGHELHLVHRDISPQNVLIGFEGEIKLIDFGIAKAAGKASKTQAGILKGKFGYMSPEQVRGLPIDRRSDIFSVGIVLYELLTGERLFMGESDFSTLEKVRNVEILPPSSYNKDIPTELERIVLKVLAKDPEDRYQNAIDLHDDLQAFLFTKGELFSRKDLAAWMKRMFPGEIEEENAKADFYRRVVAPSAASAPAGVGVGAGGGGTRKAETMLGMGLGAGGSAMSPEGSSLSLSRDSTKRKEMGKNGSNDQMEWDDEELDTQIFEREQTEEPEMLESRDIFEDDDDRTVANEPPPDVLRAATAPQLATPAPLTSPPRGVPASATPVSGARIPLPSVGGATRLPGPPSGAPKTLFGMPAPGLPIPPPPGSRPIPAPAPNTTSSGIRQPRVTVSGIPAVGAPGQQQRRATGGFAPVTAAPLPVPPPVKGKGIGIFLVVLLVVGAGAVGTYYWYQNRPGKVEISTVPADATILVDNVKVADKSPFTLEHAPGAFAVSVVRPGYGRNDQNVVVRAGQASTLSVTLEPAADTGFELTSVPPGGLVWLDGNPMSGPDGQARTDFRAYKIPPGKHLLEIKGDPRLQPWSEEVLIEPGAIKKVKATLLALGAPAKAPAPPAPAPAGPVVDPLKNPTASAPSGPGSAAGTGAPAGGPGAGAPPLAHRRPRAREARPEDETAPAPTPTRSTSRGDDDSGGSEGGDCTITVGTRPWSEVWIDGKNTNRHTPYSEAISCGKHRLSFRRPDLNLTRNETVTIRAGEKFKQSYPLEEE